MNHYVYEITNLVNGKKYIGKRSCKCPIEDDKYMGSGIAITNAIKKYGKENFKKDVLKICSTEDEAYAYEDLYTLQVNAWDNKNYYNLKQGGRGGRTLISESTRMKLKKPKTEEHRRKIGEANKGKFVSESTRNKLSVIMKGKHKGENNPFYGKTHSLETIKKIRKANIGRIQSEEEKMKKRIASSGENNPMYGKKGKDCPSSIPIYCITTGEVFNCIKDGALKYSLDSSSLAKCCKGKLKSCGRLNGKPMLWTYYDNYLNGDFNVKYKNKCYKKVINLNTMKVFNTLQLAADEFNITKSTLWKCCKGRTKSAGKINGEPARWMYYEDYLNAIKE